MTIDLVRLLILLAIPAILFARPRFIRDFMGDRTPIILGIAAVGVILLQLARNISEGK